MLKTYRILIITGTEICKIKLTVLSEIKTNNVNDQLWKLNAMIQLEVIIHKKHEIKRINRFSKELDVDPRRDDDASPMSTYRCMSRPTWKLI